MSSGVALRGERLLGEAQALVKFGVWEWNTVSNELWWSDELYRLFGLVPGAAPPSFELLLSLVHPDDLAAVESHFARARQTDERSSIEYRIVLPDGESRRFEAQLTARIDDEGVRWLTGVDQDITESRELAARLAFSDRMISIGTLAGGVAHEINNPLATISANLELLGRRIEDATIVDSRESVERIRKIVRGLMAFSRADEDRRDVLQVEHVLELAIAMTANELRHKARLVVRYGTTPAIHASESRLGHVFVNLLINAADAIAEGAVDRNSIRVSTRVDDAGCVVVEIRDTGSGIARNIQGRIFDPFFTTKPVGKGTGLGLSICHGIVRSLGGRITFTSEPGAGASFKVSLPPSGHQPLVVPPVAAAAAPEVAATTRTRGALLIIDDDTIFAGALRRLFADEHVVTVVGSGRAALDKIGAGEHFDAIVCDLMMPEMTGAELHAELLAIAPDQVRQVIFLTGGAFTAASQRFLDRIDNVCFEKPCDVEALRTAVCDLMARGRMPNHP
jgi:signal transduction histidine kinase/CheY-like chemotaxis protein